ncbi:MAG: RNHCP domain-containing protein [Oscillospiraceae bacterium]|nr:RNHCP domain-containing protein [Oscillospiraceae bacterium]
MNSRRFTVIDEGFVCTVCGVTVPPLGYTSRNHCNRCLCSVHLDENPGDRASDCGGVLRPTGIVPHKKGHQIVYKCEKCGEVKKNIAAADDDYDVIVKISTTDS